MFRTHQLVWAALVALPFLATARAEPAEPALEFRFLSFSASTVNPVDETKYLEFRNITGATLTIHRVSSGSSWLDAGGFIGMLQPGQFARIAATVHPAGVRQGFHRGVILIDTSAGIYRVPVNLLNTRSASVRLFPSGKRFNMGAGAGPRHPGSSFQVRSAGSEPVRWTASVLPGASWLRLETFSGTTPERVAFFIDPAASAVLPQGAHYGRIRVTTDGNMGALDFLVVLNVTAQPKTDSPTARPSTAEVMAGPLLTGPCSPQKMIAVQTGIGNNFQQTTAWPALLSVKLTDNCGTAITGAAVTALFTNGDSPLMLEPTGQAPGIYSATWTPRTATRQLTLTLRATATGFPPETMTVQGTVTANAAPVVISNGVLHAFAPRPAGALSPGGIVQIFGANLASETAAAPSMPLPVTLAGTSVMIGGIRAPLYFVSPGQINAQIPIELEPNREYQVIVDAQGALTVPETISLAAGSPGIATASGNSIVAQHANRTPVSEAAPARPGEVISCFLAGLGATDLAIESGAPAPGDRVAHPLDPLGLTLNGEDAAVLQAELMPGQVGLYQVDFRVPENIQGGVLPVIVSQDDVRSNTAMLAVRR